MNIISITEIIESILEQTARHKFPKKIKVKPTFYACLLANYTDDVICTKDDSKKGYTDYWTGIPVEIDNTIENEYELVY